MRRRLFIFAAGGSLLFFIGIAALWVRSYARTDRFFRSTLKPQGQWTLWTWDDLWLGRGGVGWFRTLQPEDAVGAASIRSQKFTPHLVQKPAYPNFRFRAGSAPVFGFYLGHTRGGTPGRPASEAYLVIVPLWAPAGLALVLPAACVWAWRRRRLSRGRCQSCGYDLRATPDRCPECGTAAAAHP